LEVRFSIRSPRSTKARFPPFAPVPGDASECVLRADTAGPRAKLNVRNLALPARSPKARFPPIGAVLHRRAERLFTGGFYV